MLVCTMYICQVYRKKDVINHAMLEYLDYANCKCRKRLLDKLVEECSENIDEKKLHSNEMILKKYAVLVVYTLYCQSYFSY